MKYTCLECNKVFSQKSNYDAHNRRKKPCIKFNDVFISENNTLINPTILPQNPTILPPNPTILPQKIICKYCNKSYSRKDALNRHIFKFCKKINIINNIDDDKIKEIHNDITEIKQKMTKLEEENIKLKEENLNFKLEQKKSIVSKRKCKTNINNQTNIQNQTNIIINTVNFGHEDLNKLTESEILGSLKSLTRSFNNFVKIIHLNDRIPEFSNILINNLRSDYGSIYDDGKFISKNKYQIITDLITTRVSDIEMYANKYRTLKKISNKEYGFLIDKIDFLKTNIDNEDVDGNIIKGDKLTERKLKELYKDLQFLFYDNRLLITKNIDNSKENILDV
jgi:hypothetical protein